MISPMPLSSSCQVRVSTAMLSFSAIAPPRLASASVRAPPGAIADSGCVVIVISVPTAAMLGRCSAGAPEAWLKTVVHQQGLLQIYEDFCLQDDSDCQRCTFPERVRGFEFGAG